MVFLNGQMFASGKMTVEEIVAKLDTAAAAKEAAKIDAKAPYRRADRGGGPAGAAAGVYAARKGIRTGIAGRAFGGQVNDTWPLKTTFRCWKRTALSSPCRRWKRMPRPTTSTS